MSTLFLQADARKIPLADDSVHCVVTSPPYFALRDYGVKGQIGLEASPAAYVEAMVEVFREVRRALRPDGTLWLNVGDSYAGSWGSQGRQGNSGQMAGRSVADVRERSKIQAARIESGAYPSKKTRTGSIPEASGLKPKDLIGIPWRLALALQADGWWLRADIIWHKPNPMPSSVNDRPTTAHEYVFLLTKSERYYYDAVAVAEASARSESGNKARKLGDDYGRPGHHVGSGVPWAGTTRNRRSVWTVSTEPCREAHFATYPTKLVTPCILAGTSERGCCPECGAPWKRLTDKVRTATRPGKTTKIKVPAGWNTGPGSHDTLDGNYRPAAEVGNRDPQRHVTETVTVGWWPTCKCDAGDPVPCTVYDPFSGAGTTVMVADRLGRNAVGTELNPDYIAIAQQRLTADREKRVKARPVRRARAKHPNASVISGPIADRRAP